MGTIQNSLNGMLGAAAGAATLGKHISNQNKELELKKIETKKDLQNVENDITFEQAKDVANTPVGPAPEETQEQFLDRKAHGLMNEMNKNASEGNVKELEEGYEAFKRLKGLRDAKQAFQFKLDVLGGKK